MTDYDTAGDGAGYEYGVDCGRYGGYYPVYDVDEDAGDYVEGYDDYAVADGDVCDADACYVDVDVGYAVVDYGGYRAAEGQGYHPYNYDSDDDAAYDNGYDCGYYYYDDDGDDDDYYYDVGADGDGGCYFAGDGDAIVMIL